ncbi:zinc finger mynd-type protein [Drechslerella dactyloides]|uniref:Zinc finger mynd-type protein n=1 Tax=Drechslerella dactyloides TaxID=74499 RepID=A0AAD6J470_DREDA|nr:zinc finger mynd-type protein [Drechslerella dactyloides]
MVHGVRINCLGDRMALKRPHYETFELEEKDEIFTKHETSDILDRIGLPIFTRRLPANKTWEEESDQRVFGGWSPWNNREATFLHLCLDLTAVVDRKTGSMGYGWAPKQWQSKVGSIVVVRQDKKPLSPIQIEAICRYCLENVQPLVGHSLGEYAPEKPLDKELVLKMICRATFVIFWTRFVAMKIKEGSNLDTVSPYNAK